MTNLLIPRRQVRTQQPQGPVEIDWGNPLTRDLKFAFTGSEYTEKVSKKAATVTSFTKKPTASGIGYVQTGSGSVSYAISPLTGGACTLVSRFYFKPSASIYTECVAQILPTGNTSRAGLYANLDSTGNIASGYVGVLARLDSVNTIRAAVAGVSEGWHTVVASWNGGSVVSMWLDGIPATVAYNNSGSVSSFFVGGQQVRVFGNGANDNPVVFGAGINRALSDVEAKSISANPWQIFAPQTRNLFVPVGGGSVNASASGALSPVSVAAPTASASGSASATGACAAISITAPTGAASAGGSASASGSFASLTIAAPNATATASGFGAGSFASLSISPATATATASGTTAGGAVATGAPAQITISHAAAIAIGSAVASGGYQSIGITAPTGTTSVGNGNATASGAWAAISITAPTAYASSGFIRAPAGRGPTVIQAGSYRPSNTGGRRY